MLFSRYQVYLLVKLGCPVVPKIDSMMPVFLPKTGYAVCRRTKYHPEASRYTFTAVLHNNACFSLREKSLIIFLNAFQMTVYEYEFLSTGKLLSNMHRSTPNFSIHQRK
jgi:hypothetical protein